VDEAAAGSNPIMDAGDTVNIFIVKTPPNQAGTVVYCTFREAVVMAAHKTGIDHEPREVRTVSFPGEVKAALGMVDAFMLSDWNSAEPVCDVFQMIENGVPMIGFNVAVEWKDQLDALIRDMERAKEMADKLKAEYRN
jgi:hypothetical protein